MSAATADAGADSGEKRKGAYRAALAHRDYRLMFTAITVSIAGSWAYNVALIAFVYESTKSPTWVGAIAIGRFVPGLVFSSYGGVVADRFERRKLMITLDLVSFGIMVALTAVAMADGPPALAIVLASFATIIGTTYRPCMHAMTPQLVGERDLAAANALDGVAENLSTIVGPALGAGLLAVAGAEVTFFVNGLSFVFSALVLQRMRVRTEASDVTEGGDAGVLRQMSVGIVTIVRDGTTAVLVAFSVLASFLYGTDTVLFAILSENRLGTGSEGVGYLLTALGVGGVLGAALVNRLSALPRLGAVIAVGMVVYALPIGLMAGVRNGWVAFGLVVLRGMGTLVVDILAMTAMQRNIPSDRLARVLGVYFGLVLGAIALGALLTPQLLNLTSIDTTSWIYGAGISVLVLLLYPKLRSVDNAGAARVRELAPRITLLETLGIFAAASRPVVERLAGAVQVQSVPARTAVVTEGEPADAFYVLVSGQVQVTARGEGAAEPRFLRTMGPGEYFGEIGLLQQVPRTATVTTTEPCELYRIDGDAFLAALNETPPSTGFLAEMGGRLARTHPNRAAAPTLAGEGA